MKPITNILKNLITDHSIDILQQEQRLKAMLADLLPHDKQMLFLLELSLRAQIPQKLIAQQNDTLSVWDTQIKSLKHYFKEEYFLEDKAVESVFDCWVEVLPRKIKVGAPPKLGNLKSNSRFTYADTLNCHKQAFKQNSDWGIFFTKYSITNYPLFFKDIAVIVNANHTDSYPILLLPQSLLNEVVKQPPRSLPTKLPFSSIFSKNFSDFSNEEMLKLYQLQKENRNKEFLEYSDKIGYSKCIKEDNERKKRIKEEELINTINADTTQTFNIDYFINMAENIGINLTFPIYPQKPHEPYYEKSPTEYTKQVQSIGVGAVFFILAIICAILFVIVEKKNGMEWFLLLFVIIVGFGSFPNGSIFTEEYWISENEKKIKYNEKEKKEFKKETQFKHQQELANYNDILLPKYKIDLELYENKKTQQIKELNETFPIIARSCWKQAMVFFSNHAQSLVPSKKAALENKLFAKLIQLFPKYVKVDIKAFTYYPDITLDIDNKVFIDIEVDNPFDYKTKQETHFVGSKDDERNNVFVENNWFVLRFSEAQINYGLSECVTIVQELVDFVLSGNSQHLVNLTKISKKIETPCWTKEEARLMAINND